MSADTWRGCRDRPGKWWSLHPWRQPESEWNPPSGTQVPASATSRAGQELLPSLPSQPDRECQSTQNPARQLGMHRTPGLEGPSLWIIHPLLPQESSQGCAQHHQHLSQSRMCSLGCLLRNHENSQIHRHRKGSQPPQPQALPKGVFPELPRRSFLAAAPAHSASLSSSAGPGRKEFIQGKGK